MKQLKVIAVLFGLLFVAVVTAKIYFSGLARDLSADIQPPRISSEEPDKPGTEQEGLLIELE